MVSDDIRWNCTFRFFDFRKHPPPIMWMKNSFRILGPMLRGPNPSQLLLSSSPQSIPCRLFPHTLYLQSFSFLTSKLLIRISHGLSLHSHQSLLAKPLKLGSYPNVFHHSLSSWKHWIPWAMVHFQIFSPLNSGRGWVSGHPLVLAVPISPTPAPGKSLVASTAPN